MQSMTQGRPLRLLLRFAIPLFAGNLFQQLYNLVDTFIVGRGVGVQALAAVGSTTSMVFLVYGFIAGMVGGFGVIVSQRFGAEDMEKVRESFAISVFLSAACAIVLTLACTLLARPVLTAMNTPPEILSDAILYARIVFLGLFGMMGTQLLASVLRAVGDSKTPLYFQFISCIINILLDILFVMAFHWDVAGVAIATIIAQAVSLLLCIWHIARKYPALYLTRHHWRINRQNIAAFFALGMPMGFQRIIVEIGNIILQVAINSLGANAIAAVTTALKIRAFGMMPLYSVATAAATYTAQNYGAKNIPRIRQGLRSAFGIMLVISAVAAVAFVAFGDKLAAIFLGDAANIAALSHQHLIVNGVSFVFLALLILFRNALTGMGKSFAALVGGVIELCASLIAAWLLVPNFDFWGCAFAHPLAWLLSSLPLAILYFHHLRKLRQNPLYSV